MREAVTAEKEMVREIWARGGLNVGGATASEMVRERERQRNS